jgi:hypothetical protein
MRRRDKHERPSEKVVGMAESSIPEPRKDNIEYFIHLLYQGNPNQILSKQQIIRMTQGAFSAPAVRMLFEALPDQSYSEPELFNAMSKIIKRSRSHVGGGESGLGTGPSFSLGSERGEQEIP